MHAYGYFADPVTRAPIQFEALAVRMHEGRRRFWFVYDFDIELLEDILFIDHAGEEWFVGAGFHFNGGSIPWWLHWLCGPTQPRALAAFCLHDFLCTSPHPCDSRKAHMLLWEGMMANRYYRVGSDRNWIAVRIFGPRFKQEIQNETALATADTVELPAVDSG